VSGCGQGAPPTPTQPYVAAGPTIVRRDVHFYGNDWMYSSQPSANEVVVYKRKRNNTLQHYATMTSGFSAPMGMVTAPDGLWYIANSGASNVLVYRTTRKGPKGPVATLRDEQQVPVNVDATPNRQLDAVSNGSTTGEGASLPFLWVLLGILGGVEQFGLVGLFLGPALMAALVSVWRSWVRTPVEDLRD